MWLFTTSGFVSVVSHSPEVITVRSRNRASLAPISKSLNIEIKKTPHSDYPYRIELPKADFAQWASRQIEQITYSNFKSEASLLCDENYVESLHQVWSVMHLVEDEEARLA